MKKVKIRVMAVVLVVMLAIRIVYMPLPVYANEYTDAFWEVVGDLLVYIGTGYGMAVDYTSGDMQGFVDNYYLATTKNGLTFDEWVLKNASKSDDGTMQYSEDLVKFLQEALKAYAQQRPDEVEKINYRIIHTSSYKELFENIMDYGNYLKGDFTVPEGFNSMERFEQLWLAQTEYEEFPHLLCAPFNKMICDPDSVQDITMGQQLNMYDNYEKNLVNPAKTSCFIGEFGGVNWGDETQYHIKICTYDRTTGSITVDRMRSNTQNCRFIWNSEQGIWIGTEASHALFSFTHDAYVNVSAGWWGVGWGALDNINPELVSRYTATYNADKSVNVPGLATPNGSAFRLFATEQDAMRYFDMCADSGLNLDPNQVYTGGSITINNNGDVTINNNPPDGGNDNSVDSSEMLEKIYNRLGDILTQVKQIKWLSVADVVMDAINSFGGGIGGIVESLIDVISQVFPLCILWDVVRIFEIFEAEPVPPVFDIPIKFVWIDETVTIDLTEYETLFALLRTGEIILFLLGLFNITMSWVGRGDDVV